MQDSEKSRILRKGVLLNLSEVVTEDWLGTNWPQGLARSSVWSAMIDCESGEDSFMPTVRCLLGV